MKKNIFFCLMLLHCAVIFTQEYVPNIPVITPSRYNAIGGYHVTDTTDYFTIFANPAGIPVTDGKATWFNMDTTISNPELGAAVGRLAVEAINSSSESIQLESDLLTLLGKNGINLGFEHIGPLTVGALHELGYGTLGWGLFSKIRVFALIPTVSHIDALAGFDNLLQLSYGAPIIDKEDHYFSAGISAKGFFMVEGGLSGVEPLSLVTDIEDIANIVPIYTHSGFSFDIGLYYKFLDMLSAGLVWNDPLNFIWSQLYGFESIETFDPDSTSRGSDEQSLDLGLGIDIPVGKAEHVITDFIFMIDYRDIIGLLDGNPASRNPILNLSLGTELTLFDIVSFRAGLDEMYFNAGIGFRAKKVTFDFAAFGKELGLEPGSLPQMNFSFAFSVNY